MVQLVEYSTAKQPLPRKERIKLIKQLEPWFLPQVSKNESTPQEIKHIVRCHHWLKSQESTANGIVGVIRACVKSIVKHKYDSLMTAQEQDGDSDEDSEQQHLIKKTQKLGSGDPFIAESSMSQRNLSRSGSYYSVHISQDDEGNKHHKEDHSNRKILVERIFVFTNFILEVPSAVFDQLSSGHKTKYALMSMLLSFTTMLICIIELVYKGGEGKVAWNWRKKIPWFYYPPPSHKPFGTVIDFIGLFCGIFQCIFSAIAYAYLLRGMDTPIKISVWPLIFAFCLFFSKFLENPHRKTL